MHPRIHAEQDPNKSALIIADTGQSISYGEMIDNADRAAQMLQRLGVEQGDTIAIFLENHISYPELCWAAKNSGIYYACISSQSNVDDAAYIVDNCEAKVLISSMALADVAVAVAEKLGSTRQYLMIDGVRPRFQSYESLVAAESAVPLKNRRRGPSMLYSSGTTGRPKGVRTPLLDEPPEVPPRRLTMLKSLYGLAADTILVNPGPFYHAAPGRFMISVQRLGGTVVGFRKFDAERTLTAIATYRATHGLFVPTMFIRMLKIDEAVRRHHDTSSLRCAIHMAAPCPIPLKERMIEWWGPIIEEMYGGTEAIGHTFIGSEAWLAHKGSVGRPAKGCEIRILDADGDELPCLKPGLIYMRNGHSFEYYKDAEKTRSIFKSGGWATMGDIGYLDADGYLYLTDRQSHMIISGGVNIYPREAEDVLYLHPAIEDVAVIGIPHAEFGEEVKAVVQPKGFVSDPKALEKEIITWCRERLSPIKCPRSVDFVESLPRSDAGKVIKRLIKARYWPQQGLL